MMLSDSDDDEHSKEKSRSGSGTPSMSRPREFEQEKVKRIARNKKHLLEMTGPIEGIQDVDQDARESGRDLELASLCDV